MRVFTVVFLALTCITNTAYAGVRVIDDEDQALDIKPSSSTSKPLNEIIQPTKVKEKWVAERGDTLKRVLETWAKKANWNFKWAVYDRDDDIDYQLPARMVFEGEFYEAVAEFIRLYEKAEVPLLADIAVPQTYIEMTAGTK